MKTITVCNLTDTIELIFESIAKAHHNLKPEQLISMAISQNDGELAESGALVCDTGEFKGRSPKDKYVVKDETTHNTIWWGKVNHPYDPLQFDLLLDDMIEYAKGKEVYVRDAYACASDEYKLNLKIITQHAWQDLFAYNLFLRPQAEELAGFKTDWLVLSLPEFRAVPERHLTRQHNFTIINFAKRIILIGGSAYTGEIKKGVFSVLNYILPHEKNVLSMHCSANIGAQGDTAIFFGLSGTGKTTLSADPERMLIGDDEHGWDETSVFNFEGGCYAKCVDLTPEREPQIFNAIKHGALVENTFFYPGTQTIDFTNISKTENTRTAYPIHYIDNAVIPSAGGIPQNIFFLTCDAFGVLPPISRLNVVQAMFHFISGYTAKVAGTETGITEPEATFSACFGEPFLPLHPTVYANILGEKLKKQQANVWLVNTGWSGGSYGTGHRMKLGYTRAMISAALNGCLDKVEFVTHPVFGVEMPTACPGVPHEILNPVSTWQDEAKYHETARKLARLFNDNFKQHLDFAVGDIHAGAPKE
jgi:phosphoenolpyruvate carboxykinase (ATP)